MNVAWRRILAGRQRMATGGSGDSGESGGVERLSTWRQRKRRNAYLSALVVRRKASGRIGKIIGDKNSTASDGACRRLLAGAWRQAWRISGGADVKTRRRK